MKASKETILAIIPAYGEGRFIGQVVRQVLQYVQAGLVIIVAEEYVRGDVTHAEGPPRRFLVERL